uniref:Putative group i salivary lipocalin n=1 Tax=Rhipicephalus pulchellus TaxID=72859 RepID=L7MA06_RHIPC
MHLFLIAILFFHVLSLQEFCSAGVSFSDLLEFLHTNRKIWIVASSAESIYPYTSETCIYYRTRNLTNTSVALLYRNATVLNKTVQATLQQDPYPSMVLTDWNDLPVVKQLRYYSAFLWCAIFSVRLTNGEHAEPWCELHAQGIALREAFKNPSFFATFEEKYKEICGIAKPEIILVNKKCPNMTKVNE